MTTVGNFVWWICVRMFLHTIYGSYQFLCVLLFDMAFEWVTFLNAEAQTITLSLYLSQMLLILSRMSIYLIVIKNSFIHFCCECRLVPQKKKQNHNSNWHFSVDTSFLWCQAFFHNLINQFFRHTFYSNPICKNEICYKRNHLIWIDDEPTLCELNSLFYFFVSLSFLEEFL